MKVNGEAIYDTGIWRYSSEGPTATPEGQFSDGAAVAYTSKDIRYTVKGDTLYAIVMAESENGMYDLTCLGEKDASRMANFHGIIKGVSVLGYDELPDYTRNENTLSINASFIHTNKPLVFKIRIV